jgi:hypothetical protein
MFVICRETTPACRMKSLDMAPPTADAMGPPTSKHPWLICAQGLSTHWMYNSGWKYSCSFGGGLGVCTTTGGFTTGGLTGGGWGFGDWGFGAGTGT